VTVRHALLDELAAGQEIEHGEPDDHTFYGINHHVARMLDWLIRHSPNSAAHVIGETIGEVERRFGIPRQVTEESICTALALDGKLDPDALHDYLDRVFTPAGTIVQETEDF
jgi:hypothetical protein